MNTDKKKLLLIAVSVVVAAIVFVMVRSQSKRSDDFETRVIRPVTGSVQATISTTGSVLPKNRLEIKPPVNGRIESILVKEGDMVAPGQLLGYMSSTDRAALIDAARSQGEEALKYWEEAYKPISLIAPIKGEVIVSKMQPGQTVITSDAVIVLSDQLIIRAQVDETDIGSIKIGQDATISIDAYPSEKIHAKVDHIYYESKTVNNVTIYEVDLIPDAIPDFFRSGMNATILFSKEKKDGVLLLPADAVHREKGAIYVNLMVNGKTVRANITTGISDDKNVEVLSGISADSDVAIKTKKFVIKEESGSNPLVPMRMRRR